MFTAEVEARINELRAIALSRELTNEEAKEALKLVRQDRVSASYASSASKAKKSDAAAKPSGLDVLEKMKANLAQLKLPPT